MKALTLHQPWASLIAWGDKEIETRSWSTNYRGPIAIHSANGKKALNQVLNRVRFTTAPKTTDLLAYYFWQASMRESSKDAWKRLSRDPSTNKTQAHLTGGSYTDILPLGMIVAIAVLEDVVPTESIRDTLSEKELEFGDYSFGRFAWILKDVQPLKMPLPVKGFQRLWNWDEASLDYGLTGNIVKQIGSYTLPSYIIPTVFG